MSGTVSMSMSVGNSRLRLVATLKDHSNISGVSLMSREFFIAKGPSIISFNVFGARNSSVCLAKGTHLFPSQNS